MIESVKRSHPLGSLIVDFLNQKIKITNIFCILLSDINWKPFTNLYLSYCLEFETKVDQPNLQLNIFYLLKSHLSDQEFIDLILVNDNPITASFLDLCLQKNNQMMILALFKEIGSLIDRQKITGKQLEIIFQHKHLKISFINSVIKQGTSSLLLSVFSLLNKALKQKLISYDFFNEMLMIRDHQLKNSFHYIVEYGTYSMLEIYLSIICINIIDKNFTFEKFENMFLDKDMSGRTPLFSLADKVNIKNLDLLINFLIKAHEYNLISTQTVAKILCTQDTYHVNLFMLAIIKKDANLFASILIHLLNATTSEIISLSEFKNLCLNINMNWVIHSNSVEIFSLYSTLMHTLINAKMIYPQQYKHKFFEINQLKNTMQHALLATNQAIFPRYIEEVQQFLSPQEIHYLKIPVKIPLFFNSSHLRMPLLNYHPINFSNKPAVEASHTTTPKNP